MIRVATLNCRNAVDRWSQRRWLLVEQLAELNPHVIGLQEVRHFPSQAAWIARQVGSRTGQAHWLHATYKGGPWWLLEGIAILTRLPILERDSLRLPGGTRVAGFARLSLGTGTVDVYNTHLAPWNAAVRHLQMKAVLEWMGARPRTPQVLVGDFNASPTTASIRLACQSLQSACAVANGTEPARTVPTPLRRPGSSRGVVLDYIFVNHQVDVGEARVTFDRPAAEDAGLYPSDHYGLMATITLRD